MEGEVLRGGGEIFGKKFPPPPAPPYPLQKLSPMGIREHLFASFTRFFSMMLVNVKVYPLCSTALTVWESVVRCSLQLLSLSFPLQEMIFRFGSTSLCRASHFLFKKYSANKDKFVLPPPRPMPRPRVRAAFAKISFFRQTESRCLYNFFTYMNGDPSAHGGGRGKLCCRTNDVRLAAQ